MTREERLRMYQQYPGPLAEDVETMFSVVTNEGSRVRHNIAVEHVSALCSIPRPQTHEPKGTKREQALFRVQDTAVRRRLCKRVAQVIIDVAASDAVTMDVETAQRELGMEA